MYSCRNPWRRRALAAAAGLALVVSVTACGDGDTPSAVPISGGSSSTMAGMHDGGAESFSFGAPADPADADRTIDVSMRDSFSYDPASVSVETGQTVLFNLTNEGKVVHEFVLGDTQLQKEHEQEMANMAGGAMMGDEPNAVAVKPGQSKQLAFTFTEAGTIQNRATSPATTTPA